MTQWMVREYKMESVETIKRQLDYIFYPKSIAVIGASRNPAKIGHQVVRNLVNAGYDGKIFPINPKAREILGIPAYPDVSSVNDDIDLAVIAIPAKYVLEEIHECGKAGVKGLAIITSGFGEVGKKELEQELVRVARSYGMRLLGPNIVGVMNVNANVNASFCPILPDRGDIAFITQSGALGIALVGWTKMNKIGLSAVVSVGNKADVNDVDLLKYFGNDENTKVITMYIEGLHDGRTFIDLASKIVPKKPIIALKVGWSRRGQLAVSSHTGSLTGSDTIFNAAFYQAGIMRTETFQELFDWALVLSLQKVPKGDNTVIITNGGGAGIIATDASEKYNIKLLDIPSYPDLEAKFKSCMPDFGSAKNPVDLTGQAGHEGYYSALAYALEDDRIHAIIALYCHTAVTDPMGIADGIVDALKSVKTDKPIVVSFIGGKDVTKAINWLREQGIPAYFSPERAVFAMAGLFERKKILERLQKNKK